MKLDTGNDTKGDLSEAPSSNFDEDEDLEAAVEAEEKKEESKALASQESHVVNWLRVAVFLVLSAAAVVVSLVVYRFTSNDQQDDFQTEYDAYATKVIEAFTASVASQVAAIDELSAHMTSYVQSATDPSIAWPNVTFPGMHSTR